jgi:tetratricopeptide (TPR) repeat protein
MEVDPSAQAVIALTHEGFLRERDGDIPGAMEIYERALAIAEGDHAQCVAAHFMARHRADAAEELSWNLRALELARKVGDDRVAEYFASFNGCVGHSYERLGEPELARPYLEEGLRRIVDVIPGDGYREDVERDIRETLQRVSTDTGAQD